MSELKEGDVFRWRYKVPDEAARGTGTEYWCKSQIALFKDGWLGDTYWGENDRRMITPDLVDLTYLGNLGDYEPLGSKGRHYYDKSDILDISHANDTRRPVLVRKGAKLSPDTLIAHCEYKKERAESDLRSAERDIEYFSKAIEDIKSGKIDEFWL